jgi:hypothetical protein
MELGNHMLAFSISVKGFKAITRWDLPNIIMDLFAPPGVLIVIEVTQRSNIPLVLLK